MKIVISIWLLSGACNICASQGKSNLGQDPTRPRSRLDLRVEYQQITSDLELVKLTARVDHPIALDNGWKLNTRISQGFFFSDLPGPDNRNGNTDEGFGDLLTQAFFILPAKGKTSFGFGLRAIFPIATQDQFGTGKYSLVPIGFASYSPDWLPKGSFVGMGVRNEFGFGGDDNREDIRELQLVPIANIQLPGNSFIGFFPTIRRDWRNEHDFSFPFDVEIGRAIGQGKVASLRFEKPMIEDRHRTKWSLEARVTFLF